MQVLVQQLSGLVPDWTIGPVLIIGAILAALLVYKVARMLVKRAIGRRNSILLPILQRTAGPARLALCLAAVALVLPLAPLNEGWRPALAHLFVVATIALVGWITMRVVDMASARYLQRFGMTSRKTFLPANTSLRSVSSSA